MAKDTMKHPAKFSFWFRWYPLKTYLYALVCYISRQAKSTPIILQDKDTYAAKRFLNAIELFFIFLLFRIPVAAILSFIRIGIHGT